MKGVNRDRLIAQALEQDGRTTLKELGQTVGMTSMGVKKRLEKIIKEGAIRISVDTNVEAQRLSVVMLLLEAESRDIVSEIVKRYEHCPRLVAMFTTLGSYNMMALVIAEDTDTLGCILSRQCSIRSHRGIRKSEAYQIHNVYYSPFLHIRRSLAHRKYLMTPCGFDCGTCICFKELKCPGCPAIKIYRGSL